MIHETIRRCNSDLHLRGAGPEINILGSTCLTETTLQQIENQQYKAIISGPLFKN
jgi:hypothetical protein